MQRGLIINVAIDGGHDFNNCEKLKNELTNFMAGTQPFLNAIFSGGAKGADALAENFAAENNIEIIVFKPDHAKFCRGAYHTKNIQIIEHFDFVFTFWVGKSKRTLDSFNKTKIGQKVDFHQF